MKNARHRGICAVAFVACAGLARAAHADPLRLRSDALVQTRSPVGLLVLSGEDRLRPWIDAETVAWVGVTRDPDARADVLTASVRVRDPRGLAEARIGRMVVSAGAIRPIHLDGARALVRFPWGTSVEAFGGFPVAPRFDYRNTFDWTVGGRLAQSMGSSLTVGGSILERRRESERTFEEAGADLAFSPAPWLSTAGRMAFDLMNPGVTDALASASVQDKTLRLEVFSTHRSPGRLVPRTSLFSVLGDFASTSAGATVRWRAFPRLELLATGFGQGQDNELGGQGIGRATLYFDDERRGQLGFELRRVYFGTSRWTGGRAILSVQLPLSLHVATEIELVKPDDEKRGSLWPWALAAIGWSGAGWDLAAAVEASAGREYRSELHVLARASYAFERVR